MTQWIEIAGTIIGLIYLWLEYRASIYLWIAGIIMPAIYLVVYYQAGLYADFGINVYYLLVALYGWAMWRYGGFLKRTFRLRGDKTDREKHELPVGRMPMRYWLPLAAAGSASFGVIAFILIRYTDSNVPLLDSFTTALSFAGMWMLARKYLEQWWVWIVVDVVSAGLYVYKELHFTAALYALYAVIAVFGYFKWKQMIPTDVQGSPLSVCSDSSNVDQ